MASVTPPIGVSVGVPVVPPAVVRQRSRRQIQRNAKPVVFDLDTNCPSGGPEKKLFKTPRWAEMSDRAHAHSGEVSDTLDRLLVEHDAEATLKCMQKDMHEERLKQLRQLQTSIVEDDWRYTPVDKLIGLH